MTVICAEYSDYDALNQLKADLRNQTYASLTVYDIKVDDKGRDEVIALGEAQVSLGNLDDDLPVYYRDLGETSFELIGYVKVKARHAYGTLLKNRLRLHPNEFVSVRRAAEFVCMLHVSEKIRKKNEPGKVIMLRPK